MAYKKTHKTKDGKTAKKGLYYNINKRKKAGTSRSKKKSTISPDAYKNIIMDKKTREKLKIHSKHHSKKHMSMMIKEINQGKSFNSAHKKAQKLIGK